MTDNVSVKFNDKAFLAAMQKAPVEVSIAMEQAVLKAAKQTVQEIKESPTFPAYRETLRKSILEERIGNFTYRVAPHVNYAESVEFGREPGKVPTVGAGTKKNG